MSKASVRPYSRYSLEAVSLLGKLILTARKERKVTSQEITDHAGISRGLTKRHTIDPTI